MKNLNIIEEEMWAYTLALNKSFGKISISKCANAYIENNKIYLTTLSLLHLLFIFRKKVVNSVKFIVTLISF